MAGRKRSGKSRKGRRSTKAAPRGLRNQRDEPDLLRDVRRAMADRDPLNLLGFVSALMLATDPRRKNPFERSDSDGLTLAELVDMFIGTANPETSALLAGIGEMAADEVLHARIGRELSTRPAVEPSWLRHLSDVETYRAVRMHHVLNDGDNIILGAMMPGGREFTCAVYIDHNVGTLVKDAFVLPESIDSVLVKYTQLADDPDTRWDDVDLADARTWIQEAIDRAAITYPPFETETWPECRALIEWIIRGLPGDGAEYPRPQWTSEDLDGLTERFFTSQHGRQLDDAEHRGLLENLLWYGTDYGPGDPTRWSAVRVEILLADWLPRKIVASIDYLEKAPALLRKFIRFAHHEAGIRADLTDEVLAAVDHWEPVYQEAIRAPRLQGADAMLAAMGMVGGEDDDGLYDEKDVARGGLERLARQVGGEQQLADLDANALPDEPFWWDGIAHDIGPRVREVLSLVDVCCEEMFDVEMRTACRRFLAHVAMTGPQVFRRAKRLDLAASSVVWIVAKVNDALGLYYGAGGPQAQELAAHFGVKGSPSQKSSALLQAGGFDWRNTHDLTLGSPDYLVSARRQEIMELRDRYQAILDRSDLHD